MDPTYAIIIIVLLVLAILLLIAELFVIGGVLGTFGVLLLVAAIALSFYFYGTTIGIVVTLASGFIAAIILWLGIRVLHKTKFGRSIFLQEEISSANGFESADSTLDEYIGKTGVTTSELRPSGLAEFNEERITVSTEGEFIEAGVPVEVIGIRYNQIVVRKKAE